MVLCGSSKECMVYRRKAEYLRTRACLACNTDSTWSLPIILPGFMCIDGELNVAEDFQGVCMKIEAVNFYSKILSPVRILDQNRKFP